MTHCPIFAAISAAKRISDEGVALVDELQSTLARLGEDVFNISAAKWIEENWNWTWQISLRLSSRQRSSHYLRFHFDLTRTISEENIRPTWAHAREALIVVGFDPKPQRGWPDLSVADTGQLQNDDAWQNCRDSIYADGRLLEWKSERLGEKWSQRAWAFAIPLRLIDGPKAVVEQLATPVTALLKNVAPDVVMQSTHAIFWSTSTPVAPRMR